MDDQGLEPRGAPPATSEPDAPSQPLQPSQIPQPNTEPPSTPLTGGTPYPMQPPAPYPTYPSAAPGAPSTPLVPGGAAPAYPTPTYPSYPAYPAYPTSPGSASVPLAPDAPGAASSGTYPGAPGTLPSGTVPPGMTPYYPVAPYPYMPSFPVAATIPLAPQRRLAQPFPLWLTAVIAAGTLVLLVIAFLIGSLIGGQDWAGSAFVAGIVAVVLALGAIALLVVRVALGRRASATIALGVVGIVLLASLAVGGLAGSAPIHTLQAHALEAGSSWSTAIHEYALSGEHAPNAPDIARVYDEWGESLLQQKSFASAVDRFNTVINTYASSGAAAVNRANLGLLHTYGAWIVANTGNVPYATADAFLATYAASSACDAACRTQANAFEAQGRFQYGQQLASQGLYQGAITEFEAIQSEFPTSTYAPQAHTEAAKAYLALGKQQINSETCSTDAVATYQTLAKKYSDTPEGKQAQAALKAPVTVTGHISGPYPRNPPPAAVLSKHVDPNNFVFSSEYVTPINASSGAFTFRNVQQGNYNFTTIAVTATAIEYVTWFGPNNDTYFVKVGPLCTVTLNTLGDYPSS